MFWLLIAAAIAVGVLSWGLYRQYESSQLQKFNDKRRASSRLVSLGQFVDGSLRVDVALALTDSAFFYENESMQASLDLEWIEEVGYENALSTGHAIVRGEVLRLRCMRQVFEFILSSKVLAAWKVAMPARHGTPAIAPAMTGSLAPEFA